MTDIEFDSAKNKANVAKHGVPLELAVFLFEGPHKVIADDRRDYGEPRFRAYGLINGRLFVCVYTERSEMIRVISLRKANRREQDAYHQS